MPKLAVLQHAMSPDMEANLATAERLMARAASEGSDIVVFPEVQLSPFFPKHRDADQPGVADRYVMGADHPALARLSELAATHRLVTIPNVYRQTEDGTRYDASPVFDADGRQLGMSDMVHVAQFEDFWEKDYYAHGKGFEVYDTAAGRIGVVICYDRHFPESWRRCALAGAEIIAIPSCNLASENTTLFAHEIAVMAYQNSVFAAMSNRCGTEEGTQYAGHSVIAGPDGTLLAEAGPGEEVLIADLDLDHRRAVARKAGWLHELQDWLKPGA
ncbi:carbon-nitrogen hydrolase family protein [Maricaulaceae bacterium EIL42A08]|nr:carbon-nitrogen hydrolase family protein [Maricaulaceae bacterium EIL42A08]